MSGSEALLHALREHAGKRRRLELEELWRVFRAALPIEYSDGGRAALAEHLERLAALGHLRLPGAARWDRSTRPPLPAWAQLAAAEPLAAPVDHREVAWPPELAFLVDEPRMSPDVLRDLLAIKQFLAAGGRLREPVPLRERSVELFADEKRLDTLVRSRVFLRGSLGPELVRAYHVPVPIVWERGPDAAEIAATSMLVLENLHTYDSFRRWNALVGAYLGVVYGGGKAFAGMLDDLTRIAFDLGAAEIEYFGDLDDEGLQIPASAWAVLRARELPLVAATRWYDLLLQRGERCEAALAGEPVDPRALAWLPETLRERITALLGSGRRLPQELVGWEVLRALQA